MRVPRMTLQVQLVLVEMLKDPAAPRYGLDLCAETGLPSGTIYPILARLERIGWVDSDWEHPETHIAEGRPRRRYYQLTRDGAELGGEALQAIQRERKSAARAWHIPAPGTSGAG
ncbi:MAG TPA: PadR family transcriptional regulator [Streptosporangiaceae bacterium]|nr:PadR family transcriptional regulator [Streptosporangiaceae bacterium]